MKYFNSAVLLIPSIILLSSGVARAALFNGYAFSYVDLYVGTTAYGGAGNDSQNVVYGGPYQPRNSYDLTAYSAHADIIAQSKQAVASLAIYGSDTSRTGYVTDPALALQGRGVEPMVDALLESDARGPAGYPYDPAVDAVPGASAEGTVTVQHRVVLNPAVSPPTNVDQLLNNVPVNLRWRYHFFGSGSVTGQFAFYVDSSTGDCASGVGGICGGFGANSDDPNFLPDNSGTLPFYAVATTSAREAIYDITVSLYGAIGAGSKITGFIDPYLTIDPNWEYAPYFMVQQESVAIPGEWVAINRDYLTAVPLPPSLWLFGSALLGLVGIGRRRFLN